MIFLQKEKPAESRGKGEEERRGEGEARVSQHTCTPLPFYPASPPPPSLHRPQTSSALFFQYNSQLGPPYHVLLDTNFINFSIQNKLDIVSAMMDCLFAKCVPCITDCVVGELEKLGSKFRVAQR